MQVSIAGAAAEVPVAVPMKPAVAEAPGANAALKLALLAATAAPTWVNEPFHMDVTRSLPGNTQRTVQPFSAVAL